MNAENDRLAEARLAQAPWKKWGPYLSERQWGTVREDYSEGGDAGNFFTHDHARSREYRWREDGIAGISNDQQHLCFALALWDGNWTYDSSVAFAWERSADERFVAVVNYAPFQSQCRLQLPFTELTNSTWRLEDQLSSDVYDRNGCELQSGGLFLDMRPWQAAVHALRRLVENGSIHTNKSERHVEITT